MKYCMNCGAQISDYERFCPSCGAPVSNMGYGPGPQQMRPARPMFQPQNRQPLRHCQNCGAQLRPGDTFCRTCGAPASAGGYPQGQNYQQMRQGRPMYQPQMQRPVPHCQNCGAQLSPDDKFCRICGTPVPAGGFAPGQGSQQMRQQPPRLCPNCGSPLKPDDRFCRICGTPAPVQPTQKDAMAEQQQNQPAQLFCKNCGAQMRPGEKFCSSCGAPVQPTSGTTQQSVNNETQSDKTVNNVQNKPADNQQPEQINKAEVQKDQQAKEEQPNQ